MWEIIARTIGRPETNLVLVLDEAHRGMKLNRDRKTIVRRLVDGQVGSNPPMPVVWGISATIDRFKVAMADIAGERIPLPNVDVDTDKVRASGLVKDEIGLDDPDEAGTFSNTLLREAVKDTLEFERRWDVYCEAAGEAPVLPVLVIQVADKVPDLKLAETLLVIESEWTGLGADAVVHVFGEHEPIIVGGRKVRWVPPESIQGDLDVRIVLAKTAISTGWDCPRAEVLYSERPAHDATHIAQVIGRMVRTPLTRRITTDDALNSVSCYLPLFDRGALGAIKRELEGKGASGDAEVGPEVIRAPQVLDRNPALEPAVFEAVEAIVSLASPDSLANPLRRAKALALLLTDTAGGKGSMVTDAGAELRRVLNARLDGLAAEFAEAVQANIDDLEATEIHRSVVDAFGRDRATASRSVRTHLADLDRDTRKIVRSVREGVGTDYLEHRVAKAGDDTDLLDVRIAVAALLRLEGVLTAIEERATQWVTGHQTTHAVAISNTTGATLEAFRRVRAQASTPEPVTLELRANEQVATKDAHGNLLTTYAGNLFSDGQGRYPADLNDWESAVVETELGRASFVAWYRNPSRPIPSAVRIAYRDDAGTWTSLQVDFVIVSRRDDGSLGVSLIDPHGDHFADARAKLVAMAGYAERFGEAFVRIESLVVVGGGLRSLDLLDPAVRTAIRGFEGAEVTALYGSDVSGRTSDGRAVAGSVGGVVDLGGGGDLFHRGDGGFALVLVAGGRDGEVDDGLGVDGRTLDAGLEVQVGPGGEAGAADQADGVAALHVLANRHVDAALVGVERGQREAVVDHGGVAVAPTQAGPDHDAVGRGVDGRPARRADVTAGVEAGGAQDGVSTLAELGADRISGDGVGDEDGARRQRRLAGLQASQEGRQVVRRLVHGGDLALDQRLAPLHLAKGVALGSDLDLDVGHQQHLAVAG